jgi:SAM-dependent methyltransferase
MPSLSELYSASDSDPAPVVGFLQALAASYGLSQPLHVPGRLLIPLERLRWQVTGMEPNPEFIASARATAGSSRRVTVRPGGFLDIDQHESFELVVAINSSFAHLLHPGERADALRRIYNALRPGAVVCLDVPNFLWILKNYRATEPFTFSIHGQSVTLERRHEIDVHRATFTTVDYVLAQNGSLEAQLVHTYGMAAFPEFKHQFHELGFTDLRTFRGYSSRESERLNGPRMLLSARKPAT